MYAAYAEAADPEGADGHGADGDRAEGKRAKGQGPDHRAAGGRAGRCDAGARLKQRPVVRLPADDLLRQGLGVFDRGHEIGAP